eukprot:CAMPEP_0176416694 /NCGR_PEP_ID=MMETSP0127-20121128/6482_1 /TAXON_ID=938130 /ORGANISM="Platyophrya macrostoma, Strain WH" /LENGTH=393 /DNA_ID=CAMNT_0017796785 /DNA_START=100 /DNA_END=1281 /DNA_ORIENTATION=-
MGCKNSRSKENQNRFDPRGRSESRLDTRESPRNHSRTPSRTPSGTPRSSREKELQREREVERKVQAARPKVHVTEVPLTLARFESLPPDCIKRYVFRVYDGDTITLRGEDNAKVRLLAMDSPEMQFNEPYAVEARDFVARYILDKKVYLGFEGVEKDRYGRYLAYVFVKDTSVDPYRYLCVNVAVVEAGLGNYYHPQGTPLSMDQIFLDAQAKARKEGVNVWHGVDESFEVYLTPHGHAFHKKDCSSIQNVPLSCMTMKEALDVGHYACRDCHPNWASQLPNKERLLTAAKGIPTTESVDNSIKQPVETEGLPNETSGEGSVGPADVKNPITVESEVGEAKVDVETERKQEIDDSTAVVAEPSEPAAEIDRVASPPNRPSTNRETNSEPALVQ